MKNNNLLIRIVPRMNLSKTFSYISMYLETKSLICLCARHIESDRCNNIKYGSIKEYILNE